MGSIGGNTTYQGGGTQTRAWGERPSYNAYDGAMALGSSFGRRQPPRPQAPPPDLAGGSRGDDARLDAMRRGAEMHQLQSMMAPAPKKFISGAGIVPGYIDDVEAMSGTQRQMFLPQNSTGNPAADAAAQGQRQENDVNADAAFQAMVQRRRAIEALGGGPSYGGR